MRAKLAVLLLLLAVHGVSLAKSHVEIAEEYGPCVVAVNIANKRGGTFNGTGFIVSSDGLIATNKHVVQDAAYINITFNTGVVSDAAQFVSQSKTVDLALIKIDAKNLPTVVLGDSDYALPGEDITVIGNPRRLQNTISNGLISQVRLMRKGIIWHQISAPISPSSSGSPVFNNKGEVVSVAFSTYKGADNQNLNFAIPSNYLKELMLESGYAPPLPSTINSDNMLLAKIKDYLVICWATLQKYF